VGVFVQKLASQEGGEVPREKQKGKNWVWAPVGFNLKKWPK